MNTPVGVRLVQNCGRTILDRVVLLLVYYHFHRKKKLAFERVNSVVFKIYFLLVGAGAYPRTNKVFVILNDAEDALETKQNL